MIFIRYPKSLNHVHASRPNAPGGTGTEACGADTDEDDEEGPALPAAVEGAAVEGAAVEAEAVAAVALEAGTAGVADDEASDESIEEMEAEPESIEGIGICGNFFFWKEIELD